MNDFHLIQILYCILFLSLPFACQKDATILESPTGKYIFHRDLVYSSGDGYSLSLDCAIPDDGDGPFPVIVMFYGSWFGKGKSSLLLHWLIPDFIKRGYAVVTVDHRGSPEYRYPVHIQDAKEAIRWIRTHADDYDIDPNNIGVDGFSSGAYLGLMLALTDPSDGFDFPGSENADISAEVQAVVAHSPIIDFVEYGNDLNLKAFLGFTLEENPEIYSKASVTEYIENCNVPILTTFGLKDSIIPIEQGYLLDQYMQRANNNHNLVVNATLKHVPIYNDVVWAFYDQHLKN